MGVFPHHGANLPTQLWITARYLEAISLVVGTAFIGNNLVTARVSFSHRLRDTELLVFVYAAVTTASLVSIFTGSFPAAFVEGTGLTPFKIVSEYIIIGLLGLGLAQLYRHRAKFATNVFRYLAVALILTMVGEFAFTLYVSVYGASNAIGHLLKIASFYLIYVAVIKTGTTAPQDLLFRQLSEERNALAAQKDTLQGQNERLDEFASIVSHDLRNPLAIAQGNVELLREQCESERIDAISRALTRMDTLIADMLTLSREGEYVGDVELISLRDTFDLCWQNIATGGATIVLDIDRTIHGDSSRLQQLFENLLRNAVEHGGENVTVTIGELTDGFDVEDDGPGIPQAKREDVLKPGYSTAQEGTGFGLNIVKQITEAHGWEIRVTESTSGGARFEITGVAFAD